MNTINIYIIDSSPLTSGRIVKGLAAHAGINVVGNGSIHDFIKQYSGLNVDIVITNEHVNTNVRRFISDLTKNKKIKCISLVNNQIEASGALLSGASDCVTKILNIIDDNTYREINEKARNVYSKPSDSSLVNKRCYVKNLTGVIAIGASTGGTEATLNVLKRLPKRIPGIVVTQHMMDKYIGIYVERLNRLCSLEVKEARDGDLIVPGTVLIAPGDRHMAIKKVSGVYGVRCFKGSRVSGHCPSVDVLFESMADNVGKDGVGIILTGMGEDGARGLKKMHDKGAFTIGQSEEGCCVYGMPHKAYELGGVTIQRTLKSIPTELLNYLKRR